MKGVRLAQKLGALLLIVWLASVCLVEAKDGFVFDPSKHNDENLPPGVHYILRGMVDGVFKEGIVVDDILVPIKGAKFYYENGEEATEHALFTGRRVELYVADDGSTVYRTVYVVLK